jgi:uncharacterized protein YdeI (YjbR/CyaY-like superfamily)
MKKKNAKVDEYLDQAGRWQGELRRLRKILLDSELTEEFKWGKPCYQWGKSNVVILYALKESCAAGFFKGVLLKDPQGLLRSPGENSQSSRWVKFTSLGEIEAQTPALRALVEEAIAAEKAGLKVPLQSNQKLVYVAELQKKLDEDPALKAAFEALTPGRRRGYNIHFSGAKQAETRAARVEKCRERILSGKGLGDCVCGQSKRWPVCDGSHKFLKKN